MDKLFNYKAINKYEIAIAGFINLFVVLILLESIEIVNNMKIFTLVLITSFVSILLIKIILKRPYILIIIATISLIIIYILERYYEKIYLSYRNLFDDFIEWTIRYLQGLTFAYSSYLFALITIITFLISLITYFLVLKNKRTYVLIIIGAILYAYEWFQFLDHAILYFGIHIFLVMLLNGMRRFQLNKSLWESEDKKISEDMFKRIMISTFAVGIIILIVSSMLPKKIEPISWRWLDNKARQTFPQLVNWRNTQKSSVSYGVKNVFDLSFTQFQSDPKRLGGPVRYNDELLMEVISKKPVYLRGRVKDFYTGTYWKETKNMGSMQYSSSKISFTESEHSKYKAEGVTIVHKNFTTSTIFNPLIPRTIVSEEKTYYANDEYELYTKNLIMENQPYTVYYYNPDIDTQVVNNSKYINNQEYNKYLQLPETITDRTYKLANEITKNLESDYLKAKAIEEYLNSSFSYTLNPPETPHNKDFVEYFLFELKKGYCTYFASSMTVLTRCVGIPSRYIEGFRAAEKREEGRYDVYSSNAHAWVEVYIEGYGWMTFEPTPGYRNTWMDNQELTEEKQPEDTNPSPRAPSRRKNSLDILDDPADPIVNNNHRNDQSQNSSFSIKTFLIYFLSALILTILIIVVFFIIVLNRRKKLSDNNTMIVNYYKYIESLLSKITEERVPSETTYEYYNKIELSNVNDIFRNLTDTFNKACYSNEKITLEEIRYAKEDVLAVEKFVKKRIGILKFLATKLTVSIKVAKNSSASYIRS